MFTKKQKKKRDKKKSALRALTGVDSFGARPGHRLMHFIAGAESHAIGGSGGEAAKTVCDSTTKSIK